MNINRNAEGWRGSKRIYILGQKCKNPNCNTTYNFNNKFTKGHCQKCNKLLNRNKNYIAKKYHIIKVINA